MHRPSSRDFASPGARTFGCLSMICQFPVVAIASCFTKQLPEYAFPVSMWAAVICLGILCNRSILRELTLLVDALRRK
jgi:hypothetical protein